MERHVTRIAPDIIIERRTLDDGHVMHVVVVAAGSLQAHEVEAAIRRVRRELRDEKRVISNVEVCLDNDLVRARARRNRGDLKRRKRSAP